MGSGRGLRSGDSGHGKTLKPAVLPRGRSSAATGPTLRPLLVRARLLPSVVGPTAFPRPPAVQSRSGLGGVPSAPVRWRSQPNSNDKSNGNDRRLRRPEVPPDQRRVCPCLPMIATGVKVAARGCAVAPWKTMKPFPTGQTLTPSAGGNHTGQPLEGESYVTRNTPRRSYPHVTRHQPLPLHRLSELPQAGTGARLPRGLAGIHPLGLPRMPQMVPARIARGLTAPPPVPCYASPCHRHVTRLSLEPQNQNSMPRCARMPF